MVKPKVFVTRKIPQVGIDMLGEFADVKVWEGELPPDYKTILNEAKTADGLLTLLTDRIDENLLCTAANLKVVSNYAVGYDNIDIDAATRCGVIVTNTPGVLTETTADLAFALLMATARRIVEADAFVRAGRWKTWDPVLMLGKDIYGATLGLIGLGRIGYAVAKRAKGFDMKVLYYSRHRHKEAEEKLGIKYAELDTLLAESDYVSLHAPLTPETHKMINRERLGRMKEGAILINTARGGLVDEEALCDALTCGRLAGAGLDVMDPEPPQLTNRLLSLKNVVVVPHIGSASTATRNLMAKMAAENLIAALKGLTPPNIVNSELISKKQNTEY